MRAQIILYIIIIISFTIIHRSHAKGQNHPVFDSHLYCQSSLINEIIPEKNYLFNQECTKIFVYPLNYLHLTIKNQEFNCHDDKKNISVSVKVSNGRPDEQMNQLSNITSLKIEKVRAKLTAYFFLNPSKHNFFIQPLEAEVANKQGLEPYYFIVADDLIEFQLKLDRKTYCERLAKAINPSQSIVELLKKINFHRSYSTEYDENELLHTVNFK